MAKEVRAIAEARGHTYLLSLNESSVAIDFSHASVVIDHVKIACAHGIPLIIGTTGWEGSLPRAKELVMEAEIGALHAPNFSLGIAYFQKLLKEARTLFSEYAVCGVEYHHQEKKDAPSGTAKALAQILGSSPFASVRCGSIIGKHEVLFDSPIETITLTHEAKNRKGFAQGAVIAAEWIIGKKGWFSLDDLLHSPDHTLQ